MVPLALLRKRDCAPQHFGRKMDVRIRKNDPFALRLFEPCDQRVRFSEPAGRQFGDIDNFQIRFRAFEFVKDFGSLVPGAVVDGDNLKPEIVLRKERLDSAGELLHFVACGKNHGNRRCVARRQRRSIRKPWQASHTKAGPSSLNNPKGCNQAEQHSPEDVQS